MSDNTSSLEPFFNPQRIAIIGASEKGLYPAGILQSLLEHGFTGEIYPVNPNRTAVFGLPAFSDAAHTPHPADLAILTIPRQAVVPALAQCAQSGVKAAIIITAGFAEADAEGRRLQEEISDLVKNSGLRVLGPNCAGLANLPARVIAMRLPAPPRLGRVSFASQSGALMMSFYGLFADRCIGMDRLISFGNQVDVTISEGLMNLVEAPGSDVIAAFLEGLSDGGRFVAAARRALEAAKPLVVLKSGRTEAGQRAAASHTAALAGSDRVFQAVCRQFGVSMVDDLNELVYTAHLFTYLKNTTRDRFNLAVVTQSGGLGSLTADMCMQAGIHLPPLSSTMQERLIALPHLLSYGKPGNPVDVRGAGLDRAPTVQTLQPFLEDPDTDALLLLLAKPLSRPEDLETAQAIVSVASGSPKPVLVVWMGYRDYPALQGRLASHILLEAGIPVFEQPGDCIRALGRYLNYTSFQKAWMADPEIQNDSVPARLPSFG